MAWCPSVRLSSYQFARFTSGVPLPIRFPWSTVHSLSYDRGSHRLSKSWRSSKYSDYPKLWLPITTRHYLHYSFLWLFSCWLRSYSAASMELRGGWRLRGPCRGLRAGESQMPGRCRSLSECCRGWTSETCQEFFVWEFSWGQHSWSCIFAWPHPRALRA